MKEKYSVLVQNNESKCKVFPYKKKKNEPIKSLQQQQQQQKSDIYNRK